MRMLVEFQPPGGDKVVDLSLLKHRIRQITEQLQFERTPSFHHRMRRTSQAPDIAILSLQNAVIVLKRNVGIYIYTCIYIFLWPCSLAVPVLAGWVLEKLNGGTCI